jgi:tRNA 2-selenouridine synthase
MRAAPCIVVTLPLHERVRLLRQEYAHFEDDAATLGTQLDCLTALHGRERISLWKTLAADDRWDEMVERLLVEHYDPAYVRSIERNFRQVGTAVALSLPSADADAFEQAARDLAATSPQAINPV